MDEQQRVVLAVVLCVGIFLLWQFVFPQPEPTFEPVDPSAPVATTTEGGSKGATATPAGSGDDASAEAGGEGQSAKLAAGVAPEEAAGVPAVKFATRALTTDMFDVQVANGQAHLTGLSLKHYRESSQGDDEAEAKQAVVRGPVSLATAVEDKDSEPYQARIRFALNGATGPAVDFGDNAALLPPRGYHLVGATPEGVETSVRISPSGHDYVLDYELTVMNRSSAAVMVGAAIDLATAKPAEAEEGGMFSGARSMNILATVCQTAEDVERFEASDLDEGPEKSLPTARWAGIDRQYFVIAAMSLNPEHVGTCLSKDAATALQVEFSFPEESLAAGASWTRKMAVFAGPKRDELLSAVDPSLTDIINYTIMGIPLGFMARPMIFLLNIFHGWTASWGLAIVLLTLLVKGLLFPVTYKSAVSMRKMQLLKPEMDKIKENWPNDRERQQLEQLKLFKDKGVNPLGGCLPMLLQMPVWFALYRALWTSVDLYQQPFMWLADLTAGEPGIPFLALALGVVMFVQQLVTPMSAGADNQQAKIMRWVMPPMFTFIMVGLPSGLVLYIFVNTVMSIAQQAVINHRTKSL